VGTGFAIGIPAKTWILPGIEPVLAGKTLTLGGLKLGCRQMRADWPAPNSPDI
jgi:hypothetical protein